MNSVLFDEIKKLSDKYAKELRKKINERTEEIKSDDNSHFLIYRVLGIPESEGNLIDIYQNKGRFVYKYAGSFLEEAATLCLKHKYPDSCKTRILNTLGQRPKEYEIDFLNENDAIEIKWRDATTDGEYYAGDDAWDFIKDYTTFDLKEILETIAKERSEEYES